MKKKIITLLFAIVASMGTVIASNTSVDGIWYEFDSQKLTAAVTYRGNSYNDYKEYSGSIVIPSSVSYSGKTYNVTSIKGSAFKGCSSLISITIPNTVTSIGVDVLSDCSGLTSITVGQGNGTYDSRNNCNAIIETATNTLIAGCQNTIIPNSVTSIGEYAFNGCSNLTSVTIPNSITSIGERAFGNCSDLTSVTMPNSVTSIGEYAFFGCSSLTSVNIPNGVTSIESSTFSCCSGLTTVVIPNSVTSIRSYAFADCSSLTSVNIPSGVTSIAFQTFSGCSSLTSVTVPNSVTSIENNAFYGCRSLTSVNIPNGVTRIGASAFYNCSSLTAVNIPSGVSNVSSSCFYNCSSLIDVSINSHAIVSQTYTSTSNIATIFGSQVQKYTLGDNITRIGDYAFYGCSSLTSVSIPKVTSIGNNAFKGCKNITSVSINSNAVFSQTFTSTSNIAAIFGSKVEEYILGDDIKNIKNHTFNGCSSLSRVTLGSSITSIGDYAFNGCTGLTSMTLPNSVTSIGYDAFAGCRNLTYVNIPNRVTSIGGGAFENCSSLTSVTIPNSVTSIGGGAFRDCNNLTSVTIGPNVTSIGSSAFQDCWHLTSVTIPKGVTSLDNYVFKNCISLISVTLNSNAIASKDNYSTTSNIQSIFGQQVKEYIIGDDVTRIGERAFYNCKKIESISLGNHVTSIGYEAFRYCWSLTSCTFGTSVQKLENGAFENCHSLKSVTLPNSVTSIGARAFSGCLALRSINIPQNVTVINDYTFIGCCLISSLTIPEGVTRIGRNAFDNCQCISSITIPNSVQSIGDEAFADCRKLKSITIPNSIRSITQGTFYNCDSLESVYLSENISSIGKKSFADCNNLISITIPRSVTNIGDSVFMDCNKMTSMTIEAYSMSNIGEGIFYNCNALQSIFVPCGTMDEYKLSLSQDASKIKYAPLDATIAITPSENGTVEVPTTTCDSSLLAIPNYGYHFAQWSDGNTDNPRLIDVTQDISYSAEFAKNKYLVTFINDDGVVLQSDSLEYETTPTLPTNPTKESTAEFTYTFAGWTPSVTEVTEDITYQATYTETKNSYIITWLDDDGSIIDEESVEYGVIPIHDDPAKESTAEFTYTFAGWTPSVVEVTENAIYQATYTETKNSYTITWLDEDGTIIDEIIVEYGQIPIHDDPAKESTAEFTYTFAGWTPSVVEVTENAIYQATYNATKNKYLILFKDEDETILKSDSLEYGVMPTAPGDPYKETTDDSIYTFIGWMPEIVPVVEDATYTAVYESTAILYYTIRFLNWDETELQNAEVKEGVMPVYDGETPERPEDERYVYEFIGWTPDIVEAVEDVDYIAQYNAIEKTNAIIDVYSDNYANKILCNGQLFIILPDGTKYSATGVKVD